MTFGTIKHFLYSLLVFGMTTVASAQDKKIEAIAAYQMAEEEYNAKNYSQALDYVETAKNALGIANSKILYLQIQILSELGKTDWAQLKQALETIQAFEKAPDINQFAQEKRVEVAKMKISINRTIMEIESAKKQGMEFDKRRNEAMSEFLAKYPSPGMHINDFLLHPRAKNLNKRVSGTMYKGYLRRGSVEIFGILNGDNEGSYISGVSTNDDGFVEAYMITVELDNSSDSVNLELLGFNRSNHGVLIPTKGKRIGSDETFSALELSSNKEEYPYILIDPNRYTTSVKIKRQDKKDYIQFTEIYVYKNMPR